MPAASPARGRPRAHPIRVRGLSKSYGGRAVLRGVDLDFQPGKLSALLGRSGCGKSTLLRCLKGLETPEGGSLSVHGLSLRFPQDAAGGAREQALRSRLGLVFQQFHLFPHLSVLENLLLAPRVAQGRRDQAALLAECRSLLEKVGLGAHAGHFPSQLSGGQQQRAAVARALALQPEALLYDEPTSSLDPHLAREVLDLMLQLKREGRTQVMVTHELGFARRCADWVVFLEDGVVVEQGPPARLFGRPRDPRTRAFLKAAA